MPHLRSLWLSRHGQTDWNLSRRYMSRSDRALTAYGQRQAQGLARFFAARKIDVIVHSGLTRTRATAEAIRDMRKIPMIENAAWREADHGAWEGLTYREVMRAMPDDARRRFSDPVNIAPRDGESLAALQTRVLDAYAALARAYGDKRVLVVTHGGPIQALLCALLGAPLAEHWRFRIDLGSASGFDCYPTTTILRAVNVVPPLGR
jgi:2,3-bisphosphoglycerate-dependent phosphoglycerate mutase/probable phosphoglycerate mutase